MGNDCTRQRHADANMHAIERKGGIPILLVQVEEKIWVDLFFVSESRGKICRIQSNEECAFGEAKMCSYPSDNRQGRYGASLLGPGSNSSASILVPPLGCDARRFDWCGLRIRKYLNSSNKRKNWRIHIPSANQPIIIQRAPQPWPPLMMTKT